MLQLGITIELFDPEGKEKWVRSRAYDCPRGLHLGRLMEDVNDTIANAIRIVTRKQELRAAELIARVDAEKDSHETKEATTEAAKAYGAPQDNKDKPHFGG